MTMATTTTAVSPDESLVAVVVSSSGATATTITDNNNHNNTIRKEGFRMTIWSTSLQTLQCSLHYNTGNHPKSSSSNKSSSSSSTSSSASSFVKIVFLSNALVAAVWNDFIVVWDLNRGVVSFTIDTSDSSTIVWDVAAASCHSTNNDNKNDDGGGDDDDDFLLWHVLTTAKDSSKLVIQEYKHQKLVRKIKAGKTTTTQDNHNNNHLFLQVTSLYFILVSDPQHLRILNRSDGSKHHKVSLSKVLTETTTATTTTTLVHALVTTETHAALMVGSNHMIVLIDVQKGTILKNKTSDSKTIQVTSSTPATIAPSLQFVTSKNNNNTTWLLVNQKELHCIQMDGKKFKLQQSPPPCVTTTIQLDADLQTHQIFLIAASSTQKLLAIVSNAKGQVQCQVHDITDSNNNAIIKIAFQEKVVDVAAASTSSKRKHSTIDTAVAMGPGQAGGEALKVSDVTAVVEPTLKKAKQQQPKDDNKKEEEDDNDNDNDNDNDDDDDNGPTIAERLQQLQQAMDEEYGADSEDEDNNDNNAKNNKPDITSLFQAGTTTNEISTESVTRVVQQALVSNDSAMLELALAIRDPKIVSTTCQSLSNTEASLLLFQLTRRLAAKPSRASFDDGVLLIWFTCLLKTAAGNNNNSGSSSGQKNAFAQEQLRPLQNLLLERVEVFPQLLKLEGRLSMMSDYSRIEYND